MFLCGFGRTRLNVDIAALHDKEGTVAGGTIYECLRERAFSLVEDVEGVQYRHLGGFYRIRTGT